MPAPKKLAVSGNLATKAEVASICGAKQTTVDRWIKRGCPVVQKGSKGKPYQFDTAAVIRWLIDQERESGQTTSADKKMDGFKEQARLTHHKANMAELEERRLRGELIEIEEVVSEIGDAFGNVRAKLLSLPPKMAGIVVTMDDIVPIKQALEGAIHEALNELVNQYEVDTESDTSAKTAADADGQPVG